MPRLKIYISSPIPSPHRDPPHTHRSMHMPLRAQHRKHTITDGLRGATLTHAERRCAGYYIPVPAGKYIKKEIIINVPPILLPICPNTHRRGRDLHLQCKNRAARLPCRVFFFSYFLTLSFLFSNIYIWTFFAFARFNTLSSPAPSSTSASM